jgi:hypothetical protein
VFCAPVTCVISSSFDQTNVPQPEAPRLDLSALRLPDLPVLGPRLHFFIKLAAVIDPYSPAGT